MRYITIGAPIKDVIELIDNSVGANKVLQIKSQNDVTIAPRITVPGISTLLSEVLKISLEM